MTEVLLDRYNTYCSLEYRTAGSLPKEAYAEAKELATERVFPLLWDEIAFIESSSIRHIPCAVFILLVAFTSREYGFQSADHLQLTCVERKKNHLPPFLKPTSKLRMRVNVNVILLQYKFQQYIDFDEVMVCFLEIVTNK